MSRFDLISPRDRKDGKVFWQRVGTAFPEREGEGFQLLFDSLPLPDAEGNVRLRMVPSRPRDDRPAPSAPAGGVGDLDDEIPFAPEWRA